MRRAFDTRRVLRTSIGAPVASGCVPSRLPLVLERFQVSFASRSVPPLPAPLLLVHTGGKPMAYQTTRSSGAQRSLPGLVSFVPQLVRSEATLHGVGEGTVVHFEAPQNLPQWLLRSRYTSPTTFTNEVIVALTRRLMHELESGTAREPHLKALGNALLAELQRELAMPGAQVLPAASRSGLHVAHEVVQYLQAHLGETLTVPDVARACGQGVTSLSSGFRRATGITVHRYLRRARIERACELLRTTSLSVGEVAETVGFRGQAHFSTAFAAERGLTPSAYRKAALAPSPVPPQRMSPAAKVTVRARKSRR